MPEFKTMLAAVAAAKKIIEANPGLAFGVKITPKASPWEGNFLGCSLHIEGVDALDVQTPDLSGLPDIPAIDGTWMCPVPEAIAEEARLQGVRPWIVIPSI